MFILKLDEPFRNEESFISSDLGFRSKVFFCCSFWLIFYPLDPDPLSTALDVYILQYGIFSTTLHFTSGQLFTIITWLISAPYINQSTFGIVLDGIIFFLRLGLCYVITIYNTVILVRSVIKFSDRNFLFIEKV